MVRPATTELTYAWLRENTDEVIEMMGGVLTAGIIPSLGGSFCTEQRADDWNAFIVEHADQLPGYERDLAQATESVRLCAASRAESGADLVTAFQNYK